MIISYLHIFYRKVIHFSQKLHFYNTLTIILFLNLCSTGFSQSNSTPTKPVKPSHFRGLAVLNDSIAWFSGSKGSVIRTTDGGRSFDTISPQPSNTKLAQFLVYGNQTVEQYNQISGSTISLRRKDFRDIWAKNDKEAVIMSAGDSALILKTVDAGKSWTIVYLDFRKDIFLDALEIDSKTGIGMILGDPILPEPIIVEVSSNVNKPHLKRNSALKSNGTEPNIDQKYFASLYTTDFGSSWNQLPIGEWNRPQDSIESFFAASGSSLVIIDCKVDANRNDTSKTPLCKNLTVGFAGGGFHPCYHIVKFKQQSRRTKRQNIRFNLSANQPRVSINEIIPLPFTGGPGSGVYGMCLSEDGHMIAVGGNYTLPDSFRGASAHTTASNFGLKWADVKTNQSHTDGYRSGVCFSGPIFGAASQSKPNITSKSESTDSKDTTLNFHLTKDSRIAICTGTNGSDISFDFGKNWIKIPKQTLRSGLIFDGSFNACAFSCNYLWMVGNSGKFQRIPITDLMSIGL